MRLDCRQILVFTSLFAFFACSEPAASKAPVQTPEIKAAQPAAPLPAPEKIEPTDASNLFYGVYLNGHKTGWMQVRHMVEGTMTKLSTHLQASVGGMGKVSNVSLKEERSYDSTTKNLMKILFEQGAATGVVRVTGLRHPAGMMELAINAGSAVTKQSLEETDTLEDAMSLRELAKVGKVGDTRDVKQFDPSTLKLMRVSHRVMALEERVFAGVVAEVVQVQTSYPDMGITETVWLDRAGKLLEAKVGGFFVARLEAEAEAKRLDYVQDLLINAVVKPPEPFERSAELTSVELLFTGFGEQLPPASGRQTITEHGPTTRIALKRDPDLPKTALIKGTGPYVEATPFIQVNNPQVIAAAKEAVGDAADLATAVERLVHFVYAYVKDEYVPSYSNVLEVLQSRRGDCTEHSVLFVGLARALGIPARVAVGIAYWPPGQGFGWHAWAEVLGGESWYAVDPTWDQVIADATHLKLADGDPVQQARIVMLLGNLEIQEARIQ